MANMKPIRALTLSPLLLCTLLALPAAPLWAVPVYTQAAAPPPPSPAETRLRQRCMETVRATLQTADGQEMEIGRMRQPDHRPDWHDADNAWSAHLQLVLHGAGGPDLDALFNACHLADSETAKGAHLNDGAEPAELQHKIDEWLEFNRARSEDDQHQLTDLERLRLIQQAGDAVPGNGATSAIGVGAGASTSPVPEASGWAMLAGGLGLLAALAARRRAN
jgi:hypothetical protein